MKYFDPPSVIHLIVQFLYLTFSSELHLAWHQSGYCHWCLRFLRQFIDFEVDQLLNLNYLSIE